MAGFELLDDNDELLFYIAYGVLADQLRAVLKDPAAIGEAFWIKQNEIMAAAFAVGIEKVLQSGINDALDDWLAFVENETLQDTLISATMTNVSTFANQYSFELVKDINSNTRAYLQEIFSRAIPEGWTLEEIEAALSEYYGEVRASLIAITESTRAYNQGVMMTNDQLRALGYRIVDVWHTANDDRVCDICAPLDGRERGDGWNDNPPDGSHIGCRCGITGELRNDNTI